jgi:hypothetical protein
VINTYHFEHIAGDTLKLTLNLSSGGAPLDLTGATAKAAVRKRYEDATYAVTPDDVQVTVDAANSRVLVVIPGSKIQVASGKYVYDVEMTYQDGTVQTLVVGEITMYPDVSH